MMPDNYIKYSFVIPHHNSLTLLKRCVASIPQRGDVQIIIVDDNSEETQKPHENDFDRKIELLYIDSVNTKGAGKARNLGKEKAKGDWLFFTDADDYYKEGFLSVIEKNISPEYDVIYFNVFSNEDGNKNRASLYNYYYDLFEKGLVTEEDIKFLLFAPWNKAVSRKIYKLDAVCCDQIPSGEDAFLTFRIGENARKVKIINKKLYCITYNEGSLTYKPRSLEMEKAAVDLKIRLNKFLKEKTTCKFRTPLFYWTNAKHILKYHGLSSFIKFLYYVECQDSMVRSFFYLCRYYMRNIKIKKWIAANNSDL